MQHDPSEKKNPQRCIAKDSLEKQANARECSKGWKSRFNKPRDSYYTITTTDDCLLKQLTQRYVKLQVRGFTAAFSSSPQVSRSYCRRHWPSSSACPLQAGLGGQLPTALSQRVTGSLGSPRANSSSDHAKPSDTERTAPHNPAGSPKFPNGRANRARL